MINNHYSGTVIILLLLYNSVINGFISSSSYRIRKRSIHFNSIEVNKYQKSISRLYLKQKDIEQTALKARGFKDYLKQYLSQYDIKVNNTTNTTNTTFTEDILNTNITQIMNNNNNNNKRDKVIIIIDGDNVRGKTRFQLTKEQLSDCVEQWMEESSLHGKVILMYDHGSVQSGYILPKSGLAICFSGPHKKVDDVIVRDVSYIQQDMNVNLVMITEDRLLKKKCRAQSIEHWKNKKSIRNKEKEKLNNESIQLLENVILHVIDSPKFADMIMFEYFKKNIEEETPSLEDLLKENSEIIDNDNAMACLKQEVELLTEINLLKSKLKRGTGLKRKLIDKVRLRIQNLEKMLTDTRDSNSEILKIKGGINNNNNNDTIIENNMESMISRASEVLDVSLNLRKKSKMIRNKMNLRSGELEVTWERVILAEKMRQSLITKLSNPDIKEQLTENIKSSMISSLTTEYVNYINSK